VAPEIREELNHVAIQTYGIQNDDGDNFEFPSKTSETPVADNTASANTDQAKEGIADPVKAEETNTFSDDDIPF
jgi:hypothetical protein